MNAKKIWLPAIAATSLMTAFSYLVAGKNKLNFSEPQLLARLEKHYIPDIARQLALPAGWATHFAIGILFTGLYQYSCAKADAEPTVANGLVFGSASGTAGIVMWKALFALHPASPLVNKKTFFSQLLMAHLVFGISLGISSGVRQRKELK